MFDEVGNDPMKYSRDAASSRYHVASSSPCFFALYSWFLHRHFSAPVCIMKLSPKTPEAAKAFDNFHFLAISRYTWPIDREQ